ncbi:MAG: SRPBCC family protein [Candidatus Promineifilaceae bacterium]|nr:SRPBCC family protein [Candidatus Promineifilaceae bacterium]
MIQISGAVKLAFNFPASLALAYAYYTDLNTVLHFLPHIEVIEAYGDDHFRLLYRSTEFGGYTMQIYCDMRALVVSRLHMIRIVPEDNLPPIRSGASLNTATARGHFSSRGLFFPDGDETRIEYEFQLRSQLPRPLGMRLVPARVLNSITRNVAGTRMREIAEGFIDRSIDAFPGWIEEQRADDRDNTSESLYASYESPDQNSASAGAVDCETGWSPRK